MQMKRGIVYAAVGLFMLSGVMAVDRQLLQASAPAPMASAGPAPAPAAGAPQAADGVFTFDATSITFMNATSMVLSGLPNSTTYVQYPPRVNAGTFATDVYFSTQLADSASSRWLGGPQVLLQGTLNGNITNVIVIMNAPVYDPDTNNVTAAYRVFNSTAVALPAAGGVASSVLSTVASASTGSSSSAVLTAIPAQTNMANVTVFVDVANIAQYTQEQASGQKARVVRVVRAGYRWPVYYNPYYP